MARGTSINEPRADRAYVIGGIHTNTMEGVWSLLKRGIGGVSRSVSAKRLQDYVNEYTFRYNHRDDKQPMYETTQQRIKRVRHGKHGQFAPISPESAAREGSDGR